MSEKRFETTVFLKSPIPPRLALERERVHRTAIGDGRGGTMWLLLWLRQAPAFEVALLQLRPLPRTLDLTGEAAASTLPHESRECEYLPPVCRTETSVGFPGDVDDFDVFALHDLRFVGDKIVAPHGPRFLEELIPWPAPRRTGARAARSDRRRPAPGSQ